MSNSEKHKYYKSADRSEVVEQLSCKTYVARPSQKVPSNKVKVVLITAFVELLGIKNFKPKTAYQETTKNGVYKYALKYINTLPHR